jgi:hypothetical protein
MRFSWQMVPKPPAVPQASFVVIVAPNPDRTALGPLVATQGEAFTIKMHRPMGQGEVVTIHVHEGDYDPESPNGQIMVITDQMVFDMCNWPGCTHQGRITQIIDDHAIKLLCTDHWREFTGTRHVWLQPDLGDRLKGCATYNTFRLNAQATQWIQSQQNGPHPSSPNPPQHFSEQQLSRQAAPVPPNPAPTALQPPRYTSKKSET